MDFEHLDTLMETKELGNSEGLDHYEQIEDFAINTQIRYDVPNAERVVVTGNPEEVEKYLDSVQGDEVQGARGTCGLTSIANICRLNGLDVTEGMVVTYALENNLCRYDPWNPDDTGGTSGDQVAAILRAYGIGAHFNDVNVYNVEALAEAIDSGRGVIAGVDAGVLWDAPDCSRTIYGMPVSNHYITLTGVARDASTGEIAGFYICDSGRQLESDACRYIPIEKFSEAYGPQIYGADAIITDMPIRRC